MNVRRPTLARRFTLVGAFVTASACSPAPEGGRAPRAPARAAYPVAPLSRAEPAPPTARWGERFRALRARAAEAYRLRDRSAFTAANEEGVRAFPGQPTFLYNLACAYGLEGRADDAARRLDELAARGAYFETATETDFDAVRASPAFARAAARLEALKRDARPGGEVAFALAERDLLAEGVAHDAASGAFFVGSVRRRKIVRVAPGGAARDFAAEGLLGVFGLDVDGARGLLWACTSAVPEMAGYREADAGRAEAVAFDLRTGAVARRVAVAAGGGHACNDLAVVGGGDVLVSDSVSGEVLRVGPAGEPRPLVPAGVLVSPQAIAAAPDAFFVADYALGLARVDRATGAVDLVTPPENVALTGIDGLRYAGGRLVAIQNGVRPHGVLALTLAPGGRRVDAARVLARADSRWSEPTLGVVVGGALYYVANSQWEAFGGGRSPAPDALAPPQILRLEL
jgi:hypothetical protein